MSVHHIKLADLLSHDELAALGEIAAEFGTLEAALAMHGTKLLAVRMAFPELTGNPGAAKHAALLMKLVPKYDEMLPDVRDHLLQWLGKVQGLADKRNDYLHASWVNAAVAEGIPAFPADYEGSLAYAVVRKQRGAKWSGWDTSVEEMRRISAEISEVRWHINRGFDAWLHVYTGGNAGSPL